ncbi:hypothetical protein Patl1_16350 [Pistacia atlantica]|uniref:Uncharacterized protein n=1 Tax=Pistacia atlantica TaxID=434234 RepID=A0ACC1B582_9ROSI|nr:hypothetical protein Patl1_16350 [Pistacia atlantica]
MDSDGVSWFRGSILGKGSYGSVFLATSKNPNSSNLPPVMAVKSAEFSASASLQKEKEILENLLGCPYIVECYGEETTVSENGEMAYNMLLEYASGGNLGDIIENSKFGLSEDEVRRHTRSILEGLFHAHEGGYVHCDVKPDNILLTPTSTKQFVAKVGDFGLAKRVRQRIDPFLRGTPLYLAPETVVHHVQEPPSDIWALGCVVLEMLTGKSAWNVNMGTEELLRMIGDDYSLPEIPTEISKEARDFLKGCLVRNPMFRFTAEMLLDTPFVQGLEEELQSVEEDLEEEWSLSYEENEHGASSCSCSEACSNFELGEECLLLYSSLEDDISERENGGFDEVPNIIFEDAELMEALKKPVQQSFNLCHSYGLCS